MNSLLWWLVKRVLFALDTYFPVSASLNHVVVVRRQQDKNGKEAWQYFPASASLIMLLLWQHDKNGKEGWEDIKGKSRKVHRERYENKI